MSSTFFGKDVLQGKITGRLWVQMTAKPKKSLVTVRLSSQTLADFKVAAELRGASMSALLHQFIVKTVREEREREPNAFAQPGANRRAA